MTPLWTLLFIYLEPDFNEVHEAIAMAKDILDFVKSKL